MRSDDDDEKELDLQFDDQVLMSAHYDVSHVHDNSVHGDVPDHSVPEPILDLRLEEDDEEPHDVQQVHEHQEPHGVVHDVQQEIVAHAAIDHENDGTADHENDINERNVQIPNAGVRGTNTEPIKRFDTGVELEPDNALVKSQQTFINDNPPTTPLELALAAELARKILQIKKLTGEVVKLKQFISKRKQTYKRKRKDDGAPTRALSAYNIFVQDRFEELAKQNEEALMSSNSDTKMKRVPPASLVAKTGNEWRQLPAEEKKVFEERAKTDKKRYEEEMGKYQPPEKQVNKKRNKTGYNMFFSAHVARLKQSENGVPSERGSVARLVGSAWKVRRLYLLWAASFLFESSMLTCFYFLQRN